jgi:hypothetical protein
MQKNKTNAGLDSFLANPVIAEPPGLKPVPRRVTIAALRQEGRGDGEFIAAEFEKLSKKYAGDIPQSSIDAFCEWQRKEIADCEQRFRIVGLTDREINAWRRGVKRGSKEHGDAIVRAMKRKH